MWLLKCFLHYSMRQTRTGLYVKLPSAVFLIQNHYPENVMAQWCRKFGYLLRVSESCCCSHHGYLQGKKLLHFSSKRCLPAGAGCSRYSISSPAVRYQNARQGSYPTGKCGLELYGSTAAFLTKIYWGLQTRYLVFPLLFVLRCQKEGE